MLIWAPSAIADTNDIWLYIAQDNPDAANRTLERLEDAGGRLLRFPRSGRIGQIAGTRELVVWRTPYILVYRIRGHDVEIAHVVHGARQWPPGKR